LCWIYERSFRSEGIEGTLELVCLELSVVLWIAHLACVIGVGQLAFPRTWLLSSRDLPSVPTGLLFGRANRALANYVENFNAFVALD
jgi:uncharacterized MAPEG superfamily protein